MKTALARFFNSDEGAASLDWVVLTAAVIAIAIPLMGVFRPVLADRTNAIAPLAAQATWKTSF